MQEVSPLDVVRSLKSEDIEEQITQTEAELAALRQLLKVANVKEGKGAARSSRSASSGTASPERIEAITSALRHGPKSFAELKQATGLDRYQLVGPLGNGPFHQLPDKRWQLQS